LKEGAISFTNAKDASLVGETLRGSFEGRTDVNAEVTSGGFTFGLAGAVGFTGIAEGIQVNTFDTKGGKGTHEGAAPTTTSKYDIIAKSGDGYLLKGRVEYAQNASLAQAKGAEFTIAAEGITIGNMSFANGGTFKIGDQGDLQYKGGADINNVASVFGAAGSVQSFRSGNADMMVTIPESGNFALRGVKESDGNMYLRAQEGASYGLGMVSTAGTSAVFNMTSSSLGTLAEDLKTLGVGKTGADRFFPGTTAPAGAGLQTFLLNDAQFVASQGKAGGTLRVDMLPGGAVVKTAFSTTEKGVTQTSTIADASGAAVTSTSFTMNNRTWTASTDTENVLNLTGAAGESGVTKFGEGVQGALSQEMTARLTADGNFTSTNALTAQAATGTGAYTIDSGMSFRFAGNNDLYIMNATGHVTGSAEIVTTHIKGVTDPAGGEAKGEKGLGITMRVEGNGILRNSGFRIIENDLAVKAGDRVVLGDNASVTINDVKFDQTAMESRRTHSEKIAIKQLGLDNAVKMQEIGISPEAASRVMSSFIIDSFDGGKVRTTSLVMAVLKDLSLTLGSKATDQFDALKRDNPLMAYAIDYIKDMALGTDKTPANPGKAFDTLVSSPDFAGLDITRSMLDILASGAMWEFNGGVSKATLINALASNEQTYGTDSITTVSEIAKTLLGDVNAGRISADAAVEQLRTRVASDSNLSLQFSGILAAGQTQTMTTELGGQLDTVSYPITSKMMLDNFVSATNSALKGTGLDSIETRLSLAANNYVMAYGNADNKMLMSSRNDYQQLAPVANIYQQGMQKANAYERDNKLMPALGAPAGTEFTPENIEAQLRRGDVSQKVESFNTALGQVEGQAGSLAALGRYEDRAIAGETAIPAWVVGGLRGAAEGLANVANVFSFGAAGESWGLKMSSDVAGTKLFGITAKAYSDAGAVTALASLGAATALEGLGVEAGASLFGRFSAGATATFAGAVKEGLTFTAVNAVAYPVLLAATGKWDQFTLSEYGHNLFNSF
ncbi:MAG TPA: hypothetical protein PLV52_03255, partial [Candidatus Omnitrophota bacterium]|nr:hypothetical protein [Candidatus Omnitrophota bacterium]